MEDWAAAFAMCEDDGYEIAIELVLEIFLDLTAKGARSWFHSLLETGSDLTAPEVMGRGQKRRIEALSGQGSFGSDTPSQPLGHLLLVCIIEKLYM